PAQGPRSLGPGGPPKLCPTYTEVDPYLHTLDVIEALEPSELHGCHWPAARGSEVSAFLDESRRYVEDVDGLVADSSAESREGLTLRELIEIVNERLDEPWGP